MPFSMEKSQMLHTKLTMFMVLEAHITRTESISGKTMTRSSMLLLPLVFVRILKQTNKNSSEASRNQRMRTSICPTTQCTKMTSTRLTLLMAKTEILLHLVKLVKQALCIFGTHQRCSQLHSLTSVTRRWEWVLSPLALVKDMWLQLTEAMSTL